MRRASLAIASVFGPPRERRTWSSAPANVAEGLDRRGFSVVGIDTSLGRLPAALFAGAHLMSGYGLFRSSEAISRGPAVRRFRARALARTLERYDLSRVLHTGTLDMAPGEGPSSHQHYLYCDHTWHLSLLHRPDLKSYSRRAIRSFDAFEQTCYAECRHIFTFGDYVRRDLIDYYGVPPERVTTVGSGMGEVLPYTGPKNYATGRLLFIAKHMFVQKGGRLLLDAFRLARQARPHLTLTIVGSAPHRSWGTGIADTNVTVRPFVPWAELQHLLRQATLLVQPMLNDPWGQVYLEALASRTPVVGLNRNGLAEITGNGAYGVLVDEADPEALARAIITATDNPAGLAEMAARGQHHVREHFSWERTAQSIADVLGREDQPRRAA